MRPIQIDRIKCARERVAMEEAHLAEDKTFLNKLLAKCDHLNPNGSHADIRQNIDGNLVNRWCHICESYLPDVVRP